MNKENSVLNIVNYGAVDLRNNTPLLFNTHLGDPSNDYVTLEDLNVTILPR